MADPLKDWLGKHVGGTTSFGTSAIPELLTPNTESSSGTEGSSSAVVGVNADEVTPSAESEESSSTPTSVQRGSFLATPTREKMEADASENKRAETMQAAKPVGWVESFKEAGDMAGSLVNGLLSPVSDGIRQWMVDSDKRARSSDHSTSFSDWQEAPDTSWIAPSNPNASDIATQQGVPTKDWENIGQTVGAVAEDVSENKEPILANLVATKPKLYALLAAGDLVANWDDKSWEKVDKMARDAGEAISEGAKSAAYGLGSINTTNPEATNLYSLQNDQQLIDTINNQDAREENERKAEKHEDKAYNGAGHFLEDSGVQIVDDGTDDEEHRMANKITEGELKRQAESGQAVLPSDWEWTDDRTVHFKNDLTRQGVKGLTYSLAGAFLDDIGSGPNTMVNALRDARENITSYDVNIDGIQLNSKDIENADLNDQVKSIQDEYIESPKVYLPEADYWYDLKNRIVPYNGGLGYLNEDGDCVVTLMDGTELIFSGNENESPSDEAKRIMKYDLEDVMNNTASSNNTWVKGYATKPVYVGDKEITYDQAYRLLVDMASMDSGGGGFRSDSGITYGYHIGNVAKPAAAYDDDDQWTKMTADAIPYFVDTFTGSVPIMAESMARNSAHPVVKALGYLAPFSNSAAYLAASGLDPSSNRKGGYKKSVDELSNDVKEKLEAQGIDADKYQWNRKYKQIPQQAVSNYLLSLTEDLWGGVGKKATSKPLGAITKAITDKSRTARKTKEKLDTSRLYQTLKGGVGEGLEEIPGNIAEEATRSGALSWYGDYLRDENGNLLADESGNLLKEQNPSEGVAARFWEDAPESFWAGAMLGTPLSFLGSKKTVNANKIKHALNKNKYEDADGNFSPAAFDLYHSKAGE